MPTPAALALYIPAALAMAFTPGPATLFVLSRASSLGRQAGLLSAAGLLTGTLGLVAVAALGLTGILARAPLVFDVIKSAGAAYVIYLGVRVLLGGGHPGSAAPSRAPRDVSGLRLYRDGMVTELFNPKAALFYASVLPQFVDTRRPDAPLQMFALGGIFVVFGAVSLGLIAVFAGGLQHRLRRSAACKGAARWLSGAVLVALGVRLAVSRVR
jgi:threonine/homoserine/homoserine lactone efflux protein